MRAAAPALENGSAAQSSMQASTDQLPPVRPKRARIAVKQETEEVTLRVLDSSEKQTEAVSIVISCSNMLLTNFVEGEVYQNYSPTPKA